MNRTSNIFSKKLPWLLMLLFVAASCGLKDLTNFDRIRVKGNPEMVAPLAYGQVEMQNLLDLIEDSPFTGGDEISVSFTEENIFDYAVADLIEFDSEIQMGNFDFDIGGVSIDFDFDYAITLGDIIADLGGEIEELSDADGQERSFPSYLYEPSSPASFSFDAIDQFETVTFSGGELVVEMTNRLPVYGAWVSAELYDLTYDKKIADLRFGFKDRYEGYDGYYEFVFNDEPFGLPGSLADAGDAPGSATESITVSLDGLTMSNNLEVRLSRFETGGSLSEQPVINFSDGMDFTMQLVAAEVESGSFKVPQQNIEGSDQKLEGIKIADDIDLHKANLNSGQLVLSMSKTLPITGQMTLSFPSITQNGQVVSETLNFGADNNYEFTVDLANSEIDFTEDASNIFNTLYYSYDVTIEETDYYVDFGSNESFTFDIAIQNLDIQSADGDFGQMEVTLDESEFDLSLDFLDLLEGDFTFLEPTVKLLIENSLSVPVEVALNMTGTNAAGETAMLNPPVFIVPYPNYPAETVVNGEVLFDKDNSNIVEFLSLPPTSGISYGGNIKMNPEGPPTADNLNHVDMDGKIGFGLEVDVPLVIATTGITITDTLEFDGSLLNSITNGELMLRADNELPFSVNLELNFVDSTNYNNLGAKVETLLLEAAEVDETGSVINPTSSKNSVELTAANVPAYRDANAIIFHATIMSPDEGESPARITSTNGIYLNIGIKAGINLEGLTSGSSE